MFSTTNLFCILVDLSQTICYTKRVAVTQTKQELNINYFLIGEVNGVKQIFGQGNTQRTALAAGKWNAPRREAEKVRVVAESKLPATPSGTTSKFWLT